MNVWGSDQWALNVYGVCAHAYATDIAKRSSRPCVAGARVRRDVQAMQRVLIVTICAHLLLLPPHPAIQLVVR
jgi:hypothetical protein